MTRHVALICRLSPRPDGKYEGVEAQEKWGREYAARTWPGVPIRVYADKGLSAAKPDAYRPEFERFRADVEAGLIGYVWAVEQSRIERDEVRWFKLAAELDAAGIAEVHTNREGVVRVMDEVAGIRAVLNAGEVRKMKKRIIDTLAERAAAGHPPATAPFGYRRARDENGGPTLEIIPEQAEVIHWIADRVLDGWTLTSIAADLNDRGVRGGRGGRFTTSGIKAKLGPAIAGLRVRHGQVVAKGVWPPILDEAKWQAVRARITGPREVRRTDGTVARITAAHHVPKGRRYLLTGGLAVCGECGHDLIGSITRVRTTGGGTRPVPYLLCHPTKGGRYCFAVQMERVDQFVINALFDHLESDEFRAAAQEDDTAARRDAITAELSGLDAKRAKLTALLMSDGLRDSEWRAGRDVIDAQEAELRAELASLPEPSTLIDPAELRESWAVPDAWTLDERRAFVRQYVERVTVYRGRPYAKGLADSQVGVQFRGAWRPASAGQAA